MLPALNADTGLLPLGRFGATLEDVKRDFVDAARYAGSETRSQIWQDFESATQGIRSVLPVVCVWVGGSFLTEKLDPDDIDLVYWCRDSDVQQARSDVQSALMLEMFATNQVRNCTELRVDTRVCHWHLFAEPYLSDTEEHKRYAFERGFWDDFWMRKRSGEKGDPAQLADALPRRGYFEITLDGFHGI